MKKKILIIDDEKDLTFFVKANLEILKVRIGEALKRRGLE